MAVELFAFINWETLEPEPLPTKVLLEPVVMLAPAYDPKAALLLPVVLCCNARYPVAALTVPEPLV